MSFVTFSYRSFTQPSTSGPYARRYARHHKQDLPRGERDLAIFAVFGSLGQTPDRRKWTAKRGKSVQKRLDLAKARVVHKYMRKFGFRTTPQNTLKLLQRVLSAFPLKFKQTELEAPGPSNKLLSESRSPLTPKELGIASLSDGLKSLLEENLHAADVLGSSMCSTTSEWSAGPMTCGATANNSMSQRRLASNMPMLQRHLSFTAVREALTNSDIKTPNFEVSFPNNACSSPITPLDQIIHTPEYPPVLQRPNVRGTPSTTPALYPPQSFTPLQSPTTRFFPRQALSMVTENIRRRLSVVAPPEAIPMHAPRRLSYSHTCGKTRSPLSTRKNSASQREHVNCYMEGELLASPLAIQSSSPADRARILLERCASDNIFAQDFSFSPIISPRTARV